eukprot:1160588-Pelagomonas_calceolata.AAC.3
MNLLAAARVATQHLTSPTASKQVHQVAAARAANCAHHGLKGGGCASWQQQEQHTVPPNCTCTYIITTHAQLNPVMSRGHLCWRPGLPALTHSSFDSPSLTHGVPPVNAPLVQALCNGSLCCQPEVISPKPAAILVFFYHPDI